MLPEPSNPTQYINARICIPKKYEQALYGMLMFSVASDAFTFANFCNVLHPTGISASLVSMINAFYRNSGLQLDAELPYDMPVPPAQQFIEDVEFLTGGKVVWLLLAFAEVCEMDNFRSIEAAIASDPVLKKCAFIEEIP